MRYIYLFILMAVTYLGFGAEAAPGATADQWLADPEAAAKAAGAVAKKLEGMSAGTLATIGLAVLAGARMVAPIISRVIPGYGALFEGAANMLWNFTATKNQKQADDVMAASHKAVEHIAPIISAIKELPPGTLPDRIQGYIDAPIVKAALDHIEEIAKK